nr:MAG TPA: Phosphopantothenate/pantothenate synthetase [Caudoviricetes sp.]
MLNKRMVLIVIMPQIIPQMMQFQKFHKYQIEVNLFHKSLVGLIFFFCDFF